MPNRVLSVILLAILCQCSQPEPLVPALPVEQKPAAVTEAARPAPKTRPRVYHEEAPIHMPAPLCYLDEVVPGIKVDLKYCGNDNFVGRPIDGYTTGQRAILRRDAAECIRKAQEILAAKGYGLLVWDAYRPYRALLDFYAWSKTDDDHTRARFYPNITKREIYEQKYIGLTSEHCWGVAVDVTLVNLRTGKELDMGGRHDLLDASSATDYAGLTPRQRANRQLLRNTMAAAGMRNYSKEWWHYYLSPPGLCHRYDFPLNDELNQKN